MGDTLTVSVDSSKDVVQPTLEELAAKMDAEAAPLEDNSEDRPEWLPEKFKSPADLAKAYSELEKKLGSKASSKQAPEATEKAQDGDSEESDTPDAPELTEAEKAAKEATEKAGLNFDDLSSKYWEKGELDEADYKALEKSGIPKGMVDQFIAGQEAILEATRQTVFNTVGGEEAYNEMTEWAADNMEEAEIRAYNAAVNGPDRNAAMLAVKGLKAQFESSQGYEPTRSIKGSPARAGAQSYRSIAEMEADMGNPKYKTDPAFRKDVERKLANSDIF